jgi:UDP-glucose 4-epimerase
MTNIIVTGGTGFVGRHLCQELVKNPQYRVIVLDKNPSKQPVSGVTYRQLDLTDAKATIEAFAGGDICFNFAALIGSVGYMDTYQADILRDNSLILASTFEAARLNQLKWMIYSSSSMVYQQAATFPHRESDLQTIPTVQNIYGFSKLLGEYYCQAYQKQYQLNYTIIRFFNIYGPGEAAKGNEPGFAHVIPDLTGRVLSGQYPLSIIGSGEQTRCFIYITDVIEALMAILNSKITLNQDYNIGTTDEITMKALAEKIWTLLKIEKPLKFTHLPEYAHTTQRRFPDNTKLIKDTGWQPKVSLDQGLDQIITWLKNPS